MSWAGHVARWGRGETHIGLWEGKTMGKRPLGILWRRWSDNIKMGLQEVTWGLGLYCYGSREGQMASCFEQCNELLVSIK